MTLPVVLRNLCSETRAFEKSVHAGCVQDMCTYLAGAACPYSSLTKLVYVQSIVFLNDQTHRFSYCEMVMEPSQNKNNEHWGIDETKFFNFYVAAGWDTPKNTGQRHTKEEGVNFAQHAGNGHNEPCAHATVHAWKNRDILGKLIIAVFRMNVDSVVAIQ